MAKEDNYVNNASDDTFGEDFVEINGKFVSPEESQNYVYFKDSGWVKIKDLSLDECVKVFSEIKNVPMGEGIFNFGDSAKSLVDDALSIYKKMISNNDLELVKKLSSAYTYTVAIISDESGKYDSFKKIGPYTITQYDLVLDRLKKIVGSGNSKEISDKF